MSSSPSPQTETTAATAISANNNNNNNNNNNIDNANAKLINYQQQIQKKSIPFNKHHNNKKNDLESKLNRLYSYILVKYYWVFLIVGLIISISFSATSLLKQPLPNFLDPKRGFGARGDDTLTSKLIVLKNINVELQKYTNYLINVYEDVKKANRSTYYENNPNNEINIFEDIKIIDQTIENNENNENNDHTQEFLNKENYDYENESDESDDDNLDKSSTTTIKTTTDDLKSRIKNHKFHSLFENVSYIPYTSYKYKDLFIKHLHEDYTGIDLINMLPDETIDINQNIAFKSIDTCNYSLKLGENFEFYFESSNIDDKTLDENELLEKTNLLKLSKLKSLCEWDKKIFSMMNIKQQTKPCYFSLPFSIAILNGKTSCDDLNENDVNNFLNILNKCKNAYKSGILFEAAEEFREHPKLNEILKETNPKSLFLRIPLINNNICFKKNFIYLIYEYILNSEFTLNYTKQSFDYEKSTTATTTTTLSSSTSITSNNNNNNKIIAKYSSLWIMNRKPANEYNLTSDEKIFNEQKTYDFYIKYFHKNNYDDDETRITGINLIGIRQEAAMRLISQDMILVALAISLICMTTLLYLRSISIAMIVNVGVALSVGVAFFAYRIVYNIDLFPFLNMMAAFLLIGIACDDVYVLFDAWYNEKADILMKDYLKYKANNPNENPKNYLLSYLNKQLQHIDVFIDKTKFEKKKEAIENNNSNEVDKPFMDSLDDDNDLEFNPMYVRYAILSEKQMIRIMGGTLRHATSSIFVTSFTTAAAFLTNMITNLPYVQLFGLFTGTCILVYFCMIITMISAFVVLFEKYSNSYICELPGCLKQIRVLIDRMMSLFTSINAKMVGHYLPLFLIKARLILFLIFLLIGSISMVAVFYKPQLKPQANWRYQFFKSENVLEKFEFHNRDHFLSYVNGEKRNITNPEIYYIFGIIDKDTGSKFNPDDDGYLLYDKKFDFLSKTSQIFLNEFIMNTLETRRDLFLVDDIKTEWVDYLNYIQLFCDLKYNYTTKSIIPVEPMKLKECQTELNNLLVNSSIEQFYQMMAAFPRRIVFIPKDDNVVGILLRINANCTFNDLDTVKDYYLKVDQFHQETFPNAPDGYKSAWFISISFALYDLQYQIIHGTYSSLVTSMLIALIVLLITSGNIFISVFAIITISFSIAFTVAIFVLLGWELSILESIIIIMSVGLSVDFSCHYGVAYIKAEIDDFHCRKYSKKHSKLFDQQINNDNDSKAIDNKERKNKLNTKFRNLINMYQESNKERFLRINDSFKRMGSAVAMAAFTTFLAGLSMFPSDLISFSRMGQFLMLVMCTSYLYSTFFFVPLCALFGPTNNFGDIKLKSLFEFLNRKLCSQLEVDDESNNNNNNSNLNTNLNDNNSKKMITFKSNNKKNNNKTNESTA